VITVADSTVPLAPNASRNEASVAVYGKLPT